jgi:ribosomal protein L16 Arg81 hydroxylase
VQGYDFILNPGDALFMPSCYWHFNTYLEGGMAVSYRTLANTLSDIYNGIMNTTVRLMTDKVMNGIMGERWMDRKKNTAITNANEMMDQINKEQKDKMLLNY